MPNVAGHADGAVVHDERVTVVGLGDWLVVREAHRAVLVGLEDALAGKFVEADPAALRQDLVVSRKAPAGLVIPKGEHELLPHADDEGIVSAALDLALALERPSHMHPQRLAGGGWPLGAEEAGIGVGIDAWSVDRDAAGPLESKDRGFGLRAPDAVQRPWVESELHQPSLDV